jgi:hypothetical protein
MHCWEEVLVVWVAADGMCVGAEGWVMDDADERSDLDLDNAPAHTWTEPEGHTSITYIAQ